MVNRQPAIATLHLEKTEAMICGTKNKIKKKEGFAVKCKDTTINSTTEVNYLGIKIDETLSGNGILNTILEKCNGRIKFLYRQARCFPTALKKTLCQSLVQSHLDYALSSWYVAMSQKAKNKLQIIQNKMTRFILDLGPRTHITTKHMVDLNTLKLPEGAKQLRLTTTHKIYYKQAPTYIQTKFNKTRDRAQHTRGSHLNFVVPNVKGAESNTFYSNATKD